RSSYVPTGRSAGKTNGRVPPPVAPVGHDAVAPIRTPPPPSTHSSMRSSAVGVVSPLQVAVTVPPGTVSVGVEVTRIDGTTPGPAGRILATTASRHARPIASHPPPPRPG